MVTWRTIKLMEKEHIDDLREVGCEDGRWTSWDHVSGTSVIGTSGSAAVVAALWP
jgi:hypothetical protein